MSCCAIFSAKKLGLEGPMLGACWAHVGPSLGHVGLMLGLDWAKLGLTWVVWKQWGQFGRASVGRMLGSCQAFIGPCWADVGPRLGHIGSNLGRLEAVRAIFGILFFALKIVQFLARRSWAWKGLCWAHVGLMSGLHWAMLGWCWASIGPYWV